MKKLLVTALFGAFAVAQETAPEAAPSNHSLFYTVDATSKLDNKKYQGEHMVAYKYKFADGYSLRAQLSYFTNYEEDAAGDFQDEISHSFLRFVWDTPKYWDILGFKTGVQVRYITPSGAEEEGYGRVSPRLIMEKEFSSSFNLTIIPKATVYAQRNGYSRASGDRNPLLHVGIEVLPQWKFSEDLTLTYDIDLAGVYMGDSFAGDDNLLVEGAVYHEIELMYNIAAAGDLGVGAIVFNEFSFGNHQATLINDTNTFAGIRLQKDFEL
jgi:hypothetical protein